MQGSGGGGGGGDEKGSVWNIIERETYQESFMDWMRGAREESKAISRTCLRFSYDVNNRLSYCVAPFAQMENTEARAGAEGK